MSGEGSPEKRRLPVLPADPAEPAPPRPAWRWVPLGAFATFLVWLPLSLGADTLGRGSLGSGGAQGAAGIGLIVAHAIAFFAGAFGGGLLVGRLGDGTTRLHSFLSGAVAAILAWLLAANQGTPGGAITWALLLVLMIGIGGGGGALGGALGRRFRS